jgi:Flp pilus assembly protein TadG
MGRKFIDRIRREDGQALVELAFVLPLVLLLLFGIIDFGLALNTENSDTNLANITARTASLLGTTTYAVCGTQTETTINLYVDCEAAASGISTTNLSVCAGATPTTGVTLAVGTPLSVEVRSVFGWLKILSGEVGSSLTTTIGGGATMRIEQVGTTTIGGTGTVTNSFLQGYQC